MRWPASLLVAICVIGPLVPNAARPASEKTINPVTGLIVAPGWELVNAHCGGCHSHQLVTAQRGDEEFWRSTIRWMQRTQNLWVIPQAQEDAIVRYLASNYNETDWGRRPPLPASLLPAVR